MEITNKYNLPESMVNAITSHTHKGGFLSASQTKKSSRQYWLGKRHNDEISEDVSDKIWAHFGTAVHYMFEKNAGAEAEQYYETEVDGKTISGSIDNFKDGIVTDYKTVSVWSIIYKSSVHDWEAQLNTYAFLLRQAGKEVKGLQIVALCRDWQKSKANEENYPDIQVVVIPIELWDEEKQLQYLQGCIKKLVDTENVNDKKLPYCTKEELWQDDDKFAVMKKGRKSAVRLLSSNEDAENYIFMNNLDDKHYIEHRIGKPKRCEYCNVRTFCNQYQEMVKDGIL